MPPSLRGTPSRTLGGPLLPEGGARPEGRRPPQQVRFYKGCPLLNNLSIEVSYIYTICILYTHYVYPIYAVYIYPIDTPFVCYIYRI